MDPLFFGPPDDARQRWLVEGVVSGISGYGNSVGRAHGRRRADLRPLLRPEPAGQRAVHGRAARSSAWCSGIASGVGQPGRAARLEHRARRHRRRQRAGLGRLQRRRRPAPPTTPSARASRWATPSRRSASSRPAWSCSTRAGRRASRTSVAPGWPAPPARRRPGRRGHGRRRLGRAPARGGHGALGGHDQREPGAHAGHRHPRVLAGGGRDLRQVGGAGHASSARSTAPDRRRGRPAAHPRRLRRRRCWPTCRPPRSPTTPPSTTGPRAGRRAPRRRDPAAGAARATAAADLLALLRSAALGLPPVRPPAVPEHGRRPGGDAALLRLAGPGLPASERGMALTTDSNPRGARSTRGPAPRWSWPRAWPTWPASGPRPWPSSTA